MAFGNNCNLVLPSVAGALHHALAQLRDTQESCMEIKKFDTLLEIDKKKNVRWFGQAARDKGKGKLATAITHLAV